MADIFGSIGDVFVGGLEKVANAYIEGDGRFAVTDPAVQYTQQRDGRVVNNATQQTVTAPVTPAWYTKPAYQIAIGAGALLVLYLLTRK